MRRVAICDTAHFEVTYTVILLLEQPDTHITIFTQPEAFEQLKFLLQEKTVQYTWIIKSTTESNRHFINRMFVEIRQYFFTLIYFVTVSDNFLLYCYWLHRVKAEKVVLTLHDINGYFHYQPSLGIRRLIRFIGKRCLLKKIPLLSVLSETLRENLQVRLTANQHAISVPGSIFNPATLVKNNFSPDSKITIVVPGSIDSRRRDYDSVFQLLHIAKARNLNIEIVLLGTFNKKYSEHIEAQCNAHAKLENNLFTYNDNLVAQSTFDEVIANCHFIWMPLQSSVIINDGITEYYGTTICSGNMGDAIRFARPFFVPAHVQVDSKLAGSSHSYIRVEEVAGLLQELTPLTYAGMVENASTSSRHYLKESVREQLSKDLF